MCPASALNPTDSERPGLPDEEARVQQAVSVILASGFDSKAQRYNLPISQAALQFDVSRFIIARRLQGIPDRRTAHHHQQNLSPSQEAILTEWAKSLGRRSIPLTQITLREKAEMIIGRSVGDGWFRRFLERNSSIKLLWTTPLESCRARALNRSTVSGYFNLLSDIITRYNISPSNIYNMDEKGLQLGLGKRARAIVDRDQKSVQRLDDGNKELVTVIECVRADGTALKPLFIMKGRRTSPSWAENNPIQACIASSPNGWTDTELGTMWLERLFQPETSMHVMAVDDIRLLILDGHNSHCSLSFLGLAEGFKIFILCLPPHTTHALQPCDVGVFGPLSTYYKEEVSVMARQHIQITKRNVVAVYSRARQKAFAQETIQAAFRKCGIYPLNPGAVPDSAFEPALATTTQSAQPVPSAPPKFINVVLTESSSCVANEEFKSLEKDGASDNTNSADLLSSLSNRSASTDDHVLNEVTDSERPRKFMLHLPEIPPSLPPTAPRVCLYERNVLLERLLHQASEQMAADYAQKVLMDDENGQLRAQLYQKKNKDGTRALTVGARLLTHEDSDLWNQIYKHAERNKELYAELQAKAAEFRKREDERERERERKEKEAKKNVEKEAKAAQRAADAAEKVAQREAEAAEKAAKKKAEANEKAAQKAAEKEVKAAEKEAKAAKKAAEKAAKAIEKVAKAAEKGSRGKNIRSRKEISLPDVRKENVYVPEDNITHQASPVKHRPRPRPRARPTFHNVLGDAQGSNQNLPANIPVIDPQLLTAGEKRCPSITEEGMQEDGCVAKHHQDGDLI